MNRISLLFPIALLIFAGCENNDLEDSKTYNVSGFAQKGPYIIGSDVTIAELNKNLTPTGRTFFATILSDDGYFEIPNVKLVSNFVLVKVEGDYYNEAHDQVSVKELTMYSLADISAGNQININLLTHLQRKRIEYLVQEDNLSFNDAKNQAFEELLTVFKLENFSPDQPEHINILEDNVSAAILLSVSSIISQIVNEYDNSEYATWLEMLTNFQEDLADNGELNDELLGNKLLTTATVLNIDRIVSDMQDEFPNASIPDFTSYINHFIENSSFVNYFEDLFPEESEGAINILALPNGSTLSQANTYIFKIDLPAEVPSYFVGITINEFGSSGDAEIGGDFWVGQDQTYDLFISPSENPGMSVNVPVTFTGTGQMNISINTHMDGANQFRDFTINW